MANPVGRENPDPRESRLPEGDLAGRSVTPNPQDETTRKIHALGLENIHDFCESSLGRFRLSEQEFEASERARALYRPEMTIPQRLALLRLVTERPEEFAATVKPLFDALPSDRALDLCRRFFVIVQPIIGGFPAATALALCEKMATDPEKWQAFAIILRDVGNRDDMESLVDLVKRAPPHSEKLILHSDTARDKGDLLNWIIEHEEVHSCLQICNPIIISAPQLEARKERMILLSTILPFDRAYFVEVFSSPTLSPLIAIFATKPRERWQAAIDSAHEVADDFLLFCHAAVMLVALEPDYMDQVMTTFKSLVPEHFSDAQRYYLLNNVRSYKTESHTAATFLLGEGSYDLKLRFISCFSDLTPEVRTTFLPLLNRLVSFNTPVEAVMNLLRCFQANWPQNLMIQRFVRTVQEKGILVPHTIRREENAIDQLAHILTRRPAMWLDIRYEGNLDENSTVEILREAAAGMRKYFEPILEESQEGLILRSCREPTADQIALAEQLGNLLFLQLAAGVQLPSDFLLAPQFFEGIGRLPEDAMESEFKRPWPTLDFYVARHFSQFGAIRPCYLLGYPLYPTPLPIPLPERKFDCIEERITPSGKEKVAQYCNDNLGPNYDVNSESFRCICLLFRDDQDIAGYSIKTFLKIPDSIAKFNRLIPLFTSRDKAEDRLFLISNLPNEVTEQQLLSAARLILEDDSARQRQRILILVGNFNSPTCCYPFLPGDLPQNRLSIAQKLLEDGPDVIATAPLFPPLKGTPLEERYSIIKEAAVLNPITLPEQQRQTLQRLIIECCPAFRPAFCKRLASLSREALMQHLSLSVADLQAVLVLSTSSPEKGDFLSKIEADVERGNLFKIQLALDFSARFPNLGSCIYEMMHPTSHLDSLAHYLYSYVHLESLEELIKVLYEMAPEEREWLFSKLSPYLNTPLVLDLIKLPHSERLMIFERFDELVLTRLDTARGGRLLFETIYRVGAERDKACHYLRAFFREDDNSDLREELFERTRYSRTAAEVADAAAEFYQEFLENYYDALDIGAIDIARGGAILPQLAPYLQLPIKRRMYIRRSGDPAADEGGPSREVLLAAREEIFTHFRSCFAFDEGVATIAPLDPGLRAPENLLVEWRSLGRLFYLMATVGVTLPENLAIDPATFEAAAKMSENVEDVLSLRILIITCGEDLDRLRKLFLQVFSYERAKFGEDFLISYEHLFEEGEQNSTHQEKRDELVGLIRSRERLFQFAKGLTAGEGNHRIPCRAIMSHLLEHNPDLRSILSKDERWDFSKSTDDHELQQSFFKRWISEASLAELKNLIFSMTGSDSLPPGRKLEIHNTLTVDGPFPHSCFFYMEMPPILFPDALERFDALHQGELDSEEMELRNAIESLLALNLRDYSTWAALLNQLSLTNTNI